MSSPCCSACSALPLCNFWVLLCSALCPSMNYLVKYLLKFYQGTLKNSLKLEICTTHVFFANVHHFEFCAQSFAICNNKVTSMHFMHWWHIRNCYNKADMVKWSSINIVSYFIKKSKVYIVKTALKNIL